MSAPRSLATHDPEVRPRRTEEGVRVSAEVLDRMDEGFIAVDRDARYSFVNAVGLRVLQRGRDELVGRLAAEATPILWAGPIGDGLRQALESDQPVQLDDTSPTGVIYEVRIYPSAEGVTVLFRDVTQARRATEALRRSEEKLRLAKDAARMGAWDWDLRTGEVVWSERCKALFGLEPDALVTHDRFLALVHEGDRARIDAAMRRAMLQGEPLDIELRVPMSDGSIRWMDWKGSCLHEDGRATRMAGMTLDVTAQKRAEEALRQSEQRLRALADSIPQLAWMAQPDGFITWYNRRWYEYTGTTPEQMRGWGWQAVHDPVVLPVVVERWKASIASGVTFDMEFPLRGANGQYRRFLTRVIPLKDDAGRVVQWFGTNTDVTDLIEAQNALREADRAKTEFLAVLSHELRNPLAPIRNSIYILERAPATSEVARRSREVLQRQTDHLARLVDDLLDLTRISYGKIELRRTRLDAREVVRRAVGDANGLFEQASVSLSLAEASTPVWVEADPARLGQMVGNVLNNALKFTPPRGSAQVSVRAVGSMCQITVRDSGAGIEADDLQRIFEPFVQAERTRRGRRGLGLGLALVRELATRHGGAVRAMSEGPGKGAELVLELPLASPPEAAAVDSGAATAVSARAVLLVEDNEDASLTLADLLGLHGHRVTTAASGKAGLEALARGGFDALVCDVGLPDMSGYEVIRAARRLPGCARLLAVALTGYAQPHDRAAALAAGFDAHLAKPPDIAALAVLLEHGAGRGPVSSG